MTDLQILQWLRKHVISIVKNDECSFTLQYELGDGIKRFIDAPTIKKAVETAYAQTQTET